MEDTPYIFILKISMRNYIYSLKWTMSLCIIFEDMVRQLNILE